MLKILHVFSFRHSRVSSSIQKLVIELEAGDPLQNFTTSAQLAEINQVISSSELLPTSEANTCESQT